MEQVLSSLLPDDVVASLLTIKRPVSLSTVQELIRMSYDPSLIVADILNSPVSTIYVKTDEGSFRIIPPQEEYLGPECSKLNLTSFRWIRVPDLEARQLEAYRRMIYEHKIARASYYKCTLSGDCEKTLDYSFLDYDCPKCQAVEKRDLLYLILANNPEQAHQLADSDKPRVIKEMLGITVDTFRAQDMLAVLAQSDWIVLPTIPELRPYLDDRYDYLDQVLRIVAANCGLYGNLPLDWKYLRGRFLGDDELWEIIHEEVPNHVQPNELSEYLQRIDYEIYEHLRKYFFDNEQGVYEMYGLPDLKRKLEAFRPRV